MWRWLGLSICVLLLAPATSLAATPRDYPRVADALVRAYADAGQFSGTVLVAKDGKPVLRRGYGLANREWDAPATPDTRYRLGSITKQFTAVAVLQLVEQGKLGLDDPVSKAYPDAPAAWAEVTIRHLLTHTSGIPPHPSFRGAFAPQTRLDWTPEAIVALSRDKPLDFKPGTRFAYNNTGYDLLGLIVERLSGQPYADYLRDHVLRPAGLTRTTFDLAADVQPRRAAGYVWVDGRVQNAPYVSTSLLYAAGGLASTADDLLAWDQALEGGKVLRPASLDAMFRDQGFRYGLGQVVDVEGGHRHRGHGGGLPGFATALDRYPDDGLTVIVLSNLEPARAARISQLLARAWFDPKPFAARPAKTTAGLVGRYRLNAAMTLEVSQDGDRLFVQLAQQPRVELFHEFGRTWFMSALPFQLRFGDGDRPSSATLIQGTTETVGQRVE